MLTVETIRKIRLSMHRDGKSIHQTAKDVHLSRNTVETHLAVSLVFSILCLLWLKFLSLLNISPKADQGTLHNIYG